MCFDLKFSGLSSSYDAKLEVDWEKVNTSETFKAGGRAWFVSGEVEKGLDELRQEQAIQLTTNGSNEASEALVQHVYNKLLEMMFQPVKPQTATGQQKGGMGDILASFLNPDVLKKTAKDALPGFSLHAGYKMRELKTTGKSVMNFVGRSTTERHYFLTFNAGDLYKKYGKDSTIFRDVPLWDPAFQQREIFVSVDGSLEKEFANMLNSVTVTLRKKHQGGEETIQELVVKRNIFKDFDGTISMLYGSQEDHDRLEWLTYEYKTNWHFQGGSGYKTNWIREDGSMINLFTPYRYQSIDLAGDMERLQKEQIRAVVVQISYPFFDQVKRERISLRPGDKMENKHFSVTLPNELDGVDYSITWVKEGGERITSKGKDTIGLIFYFDMTNYLINSNMHTSGLRPLYVIPLALALLSALILIQSAVSSIVIPQTQQNTHSISISDSTINNKQDNETFQIHFLSADELVDLMAPNEHDPTPVSTDTRQ